MERALGVIEMSQHQINWFDLFWIISDETVWGSAMHQLELDYIILSLGNIFNLMMIFPLLLFPGFNNKSVRSTLSPTSILHICIYSLRRGEGDQKMDTQSKKRDWILWSLEWMYLNCTRVGHLHMMMYFWTNTQFMAKKVLFHWIFSAIKIVYAFLIACLRYKGLISCTKFVLVFLCFPPNCLCNIKPLFVYFCPDGEVLSARFCSSFPGQLQLCRTKSVQVTSRRDTTETTDRLLCKFKFYR